MTAGRHGCLHTMHYLPELLLFPGSNGFIGVAGNVNSVYDNRIVMGIYKLFVYALRPLTIEKVRGNENAN